MEIWPCTHAVIRPGPQLLAKSCLCSNGDGDAGSSDDSDAADDGASLESWRAELGWPLESGRTEQPTRSVEEETLLR